jgi:maleylacetoacetate isomerase
MKLYGYWRSSAAYRIRIALGLKGLTWEDVPVHLVKGEQKLSGFRAMAPIGLVPVLELDDGTRLSQSLAILDWLDRTHPEPPLLPEESVERARQMAAGHVIAVDTHPIQNVGVVAHLKAEYGLDQQAGIGWMAHWMRRGFDAFEAMVPEIGAFAFGESPGYADICLVPQLYNAHRWGVGLAPYPRIRAIEAHAMTHPAFDAARPENQPDAE